MKKVICLSLFVFTFLINVKSQNDTTLKVISTFSGKEYIGKVISDDGREVLIETQSVGKLYLPKADVKSINVIKSKSEIINNEYGGEGPFTTRYIFTNNALPIRKGENYYMLNLFGPEFHFAVSNNMNIGIMTTWIASPLILALKYTFKTKESKINFSAGTLLGTSGYLNNFKTFGGLHWLSATYGDRSNNATLSAGYGYLQVSRRLPKLGTNMSTFEYENKVEFINGPLVSFSTILKVGAKSSFVFDNMALIFNTSDRSITSTLVKQGGIDPSTNLYTPDEYSYTVTESSGLHAALLIMPGFRFQKSETKATQFSVAMVLIRSKDGEPRSFPLPMISWFRRF